MPSVLPTAFRFLQEEPGQPRMIVEALKTLGTQEHKGSPDNPVIVGWADEVALRAPTAYSTWAAEYVNGDEVPWCGLWMAVMAARTARGDAKRQPPNGYLAALSWNAFGVGVLKAEAAVGDVLVFKRKGGGHVGLCVGSTADGKYVFCLGGNQDDEVNISRFPVSNPEKQFSLYGVRRPAYVNRPNGAVVRHLKADAAAGGGSVV